MMSDNISPSRRPASRKFHDLPKFQKITDQDDESSENVDVLLSYIYENVIGRHKVFPGPFGFRNGRPNICSKHIEHPIFDVFSGLHGLYSIGKVRDL